MRTIALIIALTCVGGSASAQSNERSTLNYDNVREHLQENRGPYRQCLVRKSDGKRICRTRDEWKMEADRIAKSQRAAR